MAVKTIPKTDDGPPVHILTRKGEEYLISCCRSPLRFTLWKVVPGGWDKKAAAASPLALYDKIPGYYD